MANNPFGKVPGGMGNLGDLMKQAQKAMADAQKAEEELGSAHVEGQAGGGMVRVVVSGKAEVISVKIDPAAVDPADVETLEDLVTLAVREAVDKANALREERLRSVVPPGLGNALPGGLF